MIYPFQYKIAELFGLAVKAVYTIVGERQYTTMLNKDTGMLGQCIVICQLSAGVFFLQRKTLTTRKKFHGMNNEFPQ